MGLCSSSSQRIQDPLELFVCDEELAHNVLSRDGGFAVVVRSRDGALFQIHHGPAAHSKKLYTCPNGYTEFTPRAVIEIIRTIPFNGLVRSLRPDFVATRNALVEDIKSFCLNPRRGRVFDLRVF